MVYHKHKNCNNNSKYTHPYTDPTSKNQKVKMSGDEYKGKSSWPELVGAGKSSWPELVGVDGKVAKGRIEKENPLVNAIIVPDGSPVTDDFRTDRVRVWVDKDGIVNQIPTIG